MRFIATVALAAMLSTPAFCGDTVITKTKHTDAMKMPGMDQPAKDTTEVTWVGKDRMRIEEGDSVTIVRADLKKMFMLDMHAKTVSTIELPFDLKKYVPAEQAPMIEMMMGQMKATVTATTETKKIKDWNATKYTLTMTMPMVSIAQEIWVTKDVELNGAAFGEMSGSLMSTAMGGGAIASELKKIEGIPVLIEDTKTMMGQPVKSREEVTSIENKEAPEGAYDVPKDFTEKPFDPMAQSPMGGGGGRPRGGKPSAPPPSDKPTGGHALIQQG